MEASQVNAPRRLTNRQLFLMGYEDENFFFQVLSPTSPR